MVSSLSKPYAILLFLLIKLVNFLDSGLKTSTPLSVVLNHSLFLSSLIIPVTELELKELE